MHRARAITVPSFTLGIEFMLRLLDVETLLSRRHASLGFHSAIWCLAKDSFVTDSVLKRLYDQNPLHGLRNLEIWKERACGGSALCMYFCGWVLTDVCSAEAVRWVLNVCRWWTRRIPGQKHWLRGRQTIRMKSGSVCLCVCVGVCVLLAQSPTLTWHSDSRCLLENHLDLDCRDEMERKINLCFCIGLFHIFPRLKRPMLTLGLDAG